MVDVPLLPWATLTEVGLAERLKLLGLVTVRVTVNGDPVVSVGVQMIELEFDDVHPSGKFVHA